MGNGQGKPVDLNGEGTSRSSDQKLLCICFCCRSPPKSMSPLAYLGFPSSCMPFAVFQPHITWRHPVSHVCHATSYHALHDQIFCLLLSQPHMLLLLNFMTL